MGYQAGLRWTQSDLSGNAFNSSTRKQTFGTFGLFHRAYRGFGLQGGVVYDRLEDDFFTTAKLSQIRTEVSFLFGCKHLKSVSGCRSHGR